jgi:hypothetical protein
VSGGNQVGANLSGYNKKLIKLQVIVAKAARDGRASGEVLAHERTDDILLKSVLMIDDVIRDIERLSDSAGVIDIVKGAAATLTVFCHSGLVGESSLVPQLHSQADELESLVAQHGRDGRRIDTARHGYGNGLAFGHVLGASS